MALMDPLAEYAEDFYPDKDRLLEAVLFLMNERSDLSTYQIVKAIFLADRSHLNYVGRPITYDKYVAMEQGPVPSLTYDLLKRQGRFAQIYGTEAPWSGYSNGRYVSFTPRRVADLDVLSKTDQDALRDGLRTVLTLSRTDLAALLHDDKAYKEAWPRRNGAGSIPMKAVFLLEDEDEELIAELHYASRNQCPSLER